MDPRSFLAPPAAHANAIPDMAAFVEFVKQMAHYVVLWLIAMRDALAELLFGVFEPPSELAVKAFHAAHAFCRLHPHAVHIVSFTIFFGPIAFLVPLLLLHELAILILLNASFLMHGLLPGSPVTHYNFLRSTFWDSRGMVFSTVDDAATKYNKWTTDSMPLIILRLVALALGVYMLSVIWTES